MIFRMEMRHRSRVASASLALALLAALAWPQAARAQSTATGTAACSASASFHFASVSLRSAQAHTSHDDGATDTGFSAHRISLRAMIGTAYATDRIDGLPQWALDARYDITATVADEDLCRWCEMQRHSQSDDAVRTMFKALLNDRFLLEFHTESRPVSGYALVLAKGGPKRPPASNRMASISQAPIRSAPSPWRSLRSGCRRQWVTRSRTRPGSRATIG
jgi:uncharacterized protein (TIGR03435 family)